MGTFPAHDKRDPWGRGCLVYQYRGSAVYLTDLRLHRLVENCLAVPSQQLPLCTSEYREKHRTQTHFWLLLGCKIELIKLQAEAGNLQERQIDQIVAT